MLIIRRQIWSFPTRYHRMIRSKRKKLDYRLIDFQWRNQLNQITYWRRISGWSRSNRRTDLGDLVTSVKTTTDRNSRKFFLFRSGKSWKLWFIENDTHSTNQDDETYLSFEESWKKESWQYEESPERSDVKNKILLSRKSKTSEERSTRRKKMWNSSWFHPDIETVIRFLFIFLLIYLICTRRQNMNQS